MHDTFWSGVLSPSHIDNGTDIIYTWTIVNGQTVSCPSSYEVGAHYNLRGTLQPNGLDTYVVTTQNSAGIVTIISGLY